MGELTSRYRLRPSFSVIAHSADVVELRRGVWNPVSITLTDRSAAGKLYRALELMTGEQTLEEVAQQAQLTPREATNLVSFLTRHHAIETQPGSAFDSLLDVSHATLASGLEARPRFDRVALLGPAELSEEIAAQLQDIDGATCVPIRPDRMAHLSGTDLTLAEDPLALLDELAAYADLKGSFLIAALLTVNPILLRNLNRVCLHHEIPWLHVAADGPFLIVGPTFVPKRSPCYECFETRVAMSMRENESYLRYKKSLANRAIKVGRPALGRPFRGLLASLAAMELANFAAAGSNFTIAKALTVYLPALGFSFNEVLRAPGCAACSPMTEQHEQSLYFDLRGFVNSLYDGNGQPVR